MALVAVTGGTGFLGRHLVTALHRAGFQVRLLVRRAPQDGFGDGIRPELVTGDLDDAAALARLVSGADIVIHGAGLIKAVNRAGFFAVNAEGSAALGRAVAAHAPAARLVIISSQAATQPNLSHYAASKRAGEDSAIAAYGGEDWVVVRPPALYGPCDRETLSLFKAASGPVVPVLGGPSARVAFLHVTDAADAVVALARHGGPQGQRFGLCDGVCSGYDWHTMLDCAADAVQHRAMRVPVPAWVLRTIGAAGGLYAALTGRAVMLTAAKAREILHSDWSVPPATMPPTDLWQPRVTLAEGFQATAQWYRDHRWL